MAEVASSNNDVDRNKLEIKELNLNPFPAPFSVVCKCHVTALQFYKSYLLVGEGNKLKIFDVKTLTCMLELEAFKGCTIHGIKNLKHSDKVISAVFGAKSVIIYEFIFGSSCNYEKKVEHQLNDWILDVSWLENDEFNCPRLGIVLAHNLFIVWDWVKMKIEKTVCQEQCILYSATVIGKSCANLILAVGTVFKEVLLWAPASEYNTNKAWPFHRLTGHQGVIFSLSYNYTLRLLCSTSDDRSLKLWKFSFAPCLSQLACVEDITLEQWQKGSFHLVHTLFSHEARVWRAFILKTVIISIGEDSLVCFWDHHGHIIKKRKCHNGGSIWSLAVDELETVVATGGGDGGVNLWQIDQESFKSDCYVSVAMPQLIRNEDFPRNVALLATPHNLMAFVSTNEGVVLSYCLKTGMWKIQYKDESLHSYNVLLIPCHENYVFLGTLSGEIILLAFSDDGKLIQKSKCPAHDGKVHNILWAGNTFLLTCGPHGKMILWTIQGNNSGVKFLKTANLTLLPCKQQWASAAVFLHEYDYIIVGDRGGSIHVYEMSKNKMVEDQKAPYQSFHRIHGKNGVTDIKVHGKFVYSAGRDGRVLLYHALPGGPILLCTLKTPSNMDWIGGLKFVEDCMLLLGFYMVNFVVWSNRNQYSVVEVPCGGGHRSWDFSLSNFLEGTFICIRKHELMLVQKNMSAEIKQSVLQPGFFGRELCSLCFLFSKCENNKKSFIFAAGGEDNTLLILGMNYSIYSNKPVLREYQNLSGHISSIRALDSCPVDSTFDECCCLLVSAGGRAQMILWKVYCNEGNILCKELASDFLWTVDKPRNKPWLMKTSGTVPDPLTRYMDVKIWKSEEQNNLKQYIIVASCSDAVVRLFRFCDGETSLKLCYNVCSGNHCILNLSHFATEATKDYLVTTATNGEVNIWNILQICSVTKDFSEENCSKTVSNPMASCNIHTVKQMNPVLSLSLHQSGVNALCLHNFLSKLWLLCTGGDDNCITATILEELNYQNGLSTLNVLTTRKIFSAHAGQVTGVSVISDRFLLSTSIDQRLCLWEWKFNRTINILEILPITSTVSCIPDISHMEVLWNDIKKCWTIILCGEGLEIFHLLL